MQSRELLRFYLTGERPTGAESDLEGMRPALLAPFRDLSSLRYDYPLLLREGDDSLTVTLSDLFDDILKQVAPPGPAGERLRRHILRLEQRIRSRVAAGESDTLSQLWRTAAQDLIGESNKEEAKLLKESLDKARAALAVDGQVVDCDERLALTFVEHAWLAFSQRQAEKVRQEIDTLMLRLSNILKADTARSRSGLAADKLAESVGASYRRHFDFDAWSRLITGRGTGALGPHRHRRIETILAVLDTQRFFPGGKKKPYAFRFESCANAAATFRKRVPEMLELVKAMTVARLEIDNRYREDRHDAYFQNFDESSPTPEDLVGFPTYLVCLRGEELTDTEAAQLIEILGSSLPIKVLVESDDVLGTSPIGDVRWSRGMVGGQLGNLALGLGEAFVMQSTTSGLARMEQAVVAGLSHPGPSLFNVFSGATRHGSELPPYLSSAAAMQSRAFPLFTYDPGAGDDWVERFRVDGNPHEEDDWPVEELSYEDENLRRITEEARFTLVDFAACDARHAHHFLPVPRSSWSDDMAPAWLFLDGEAPPGKVPYVLVATVDNELQRLVVDSELIEAGRRCRRRWRSLQELGGIHNSHALRLLESERARWEDEKAQELKELAATGTATAVIKTERQVEDLQPSPRVEDEPAAMEEDLPRTDEPYIETERCTTCDECTALNSRMFAYDDNKQASIADLTAGTYREMVEAAEACQVAIIHPGKPWNPDEPDLPQLIERAAAFN